MPSSCLGNTAACLEVAEGLRALPPVRDHSEMSWACLRALAGLWRGGKRWRMPRLRAAPRLAMCLRFWGQSLWLARQMGQAS